MARRCDGDDSAPVDKVIHHRGCDVCDGATVRRCDGATVRCDGATVRATPLWREENEQLWQGGADEVARLEASASFVAR